MNTSYNTLIILGVCVIAGIYLVNIFNNLITLKNSIKKNWSNIDVLLKQRNSEIPKLVETCQQYMQYEQATLEKIIEARNAIHTANEQQNLTALGNAELAMRNNLGKLFALAENYPNLKANETFQKLQQRISDLENSISDRREFYNESVNYNNIRIAQFPDLIVARMFNFREAELLQFSQEETKDVNIKQLFKQT